mmetsp:Transcript_6199/g.8062  ORF Transcript_6199/g.8062 Transcript_6199/m.8062 type:complete len:259 (-) Transcript_6199:231-1007(-)|eukprot:CAMPEP_0198155940 /NCGR_PEP_ID=MMETSP1443-20131203/69398_1 /TAXON_ID=186043 /ORGANISM="Entomoneis sp., Strain CCMP2396" /LENGTH=258 /DNA_ID=CAMNT_0043822709 /DNA_START=149 /DNA_END=925 /DNA_ORIENTATION=+
MSFPSEANEAGEFPGCALSVISEGSFRTSRDGSSIAASSLPSSRTGTFDEQDSTHGGGSSLDTRNAGKLLCQSVLFMKHGGNSLGDGEDSEEENAIGEIGVFRTFDENGPVENPKDSSPKTRIVGVEPNRNYSMDTPEQEQAPVVTICQHTQERENWEGEVIVQKDNDCLCLPSWLRNSPFWLLAAIMLCFVLVIVCVTIGIVASNIQSSSPEQIPQAAATMPPSLRAKNTYSFSVSPTISPSAIPSPSPTMASSAPA